MENTSLSSSSKPSLRNHETALSFELALTMSSRPSPSRSAATAHRAPMAWFVTTTRSSGLITSSPWLKARPRPDEQTSASSSWLDFLGMIKIIELLYKE
eukprot:11213967-Ditylum_brightwellii.AAC.1